MPKENRRTARKRAKEIAEYGLAGTAVRDSVREVQAAVMAAAIASTVAAASGGARRRRLPGVYGNVTSTLGIRRGQMLALGAAFPLWALTEPRRTRTTATRAGFEESSPKCWSSAPSMVGHPLPALVKASHAADLRARREPRPRWPWC